MSYGIDLSTEAQHDLARMPIPVRRSVLRQLQALAVSPTAISRPSHFPYREKCQLFELDTDHGMQRWEVRVMFQYGADEQTIHVICVGRSIRDVGDGTEL